MPPSYFPLRWESTGDHWWYASPIDWAAANGHYDLVRELLHIDANLLMKLTSLRRIRRLETVWDDDSHFEDVARCRSTVARNLLLDCESKRGRNALIKAGYGGWLLYTAASAGDISFVQELLERYPLLVFGEGEYGVTDIFYAAARSKNCEVFRVLFDFSVSPRCLGSIRLQQESDAKVSVLRLEMVNRALHAAARGGNLEILTELLGFCSDILSYRDVHGGTILHAAAGRGQVEVVKYLMSSFDVMTSRDNQGNTALHVAAFRGHLAVMEALISAYPYSATLTNHSGDTFLHVAVAGFRTPGFRRLDRQMGLMKHLVSGRMIYIDNIVNARNKDGRTILHMAVSGNLHFDLVELLMNISSMDVNIQDGNGATPLDLLKQRPHSASREILIKRLITSGGFSNSDDDKARSAIVSHLKLQSFGNSPGTLFKVSDAEILLFTGIEASDVGGDRISARSSSCSSNSKSDIVPPVVLNDNRNSSNEKKKASVNYAARGLKVLLGLPCQKTKKNKILKKFADDDSIESCKKWSDCDDTPTPLRLRFSKHTSIQNSKRILSVRNSARSPSTKKKFSAGVKLGVIQSIPQLALPRKATSSSFSRPPVSSPTLDKPIGVCSEIETSETTCLSSSVGGGVNKPSQRSRLMNTRLMNQYFCFGTQGLSVEDSINGKKSNLAYKQTVLSAA